jgi:FAD/FMN-containing dehydrogenase
VKLLPGSAAARKPFVGRVVPPPRAVARCAGTRDVARAVTLGRPFALRSGGHSYAEWSATPDLLIDLGGMDAVRVDGDTVTTGPGTRIGALAARLAAAGRMVPIGWCPDVGVGGAVLGGGYGLFGRRYGLGCDHLLSAEVVLAGGTVVRCDQQRHPELFWALRGAGGGLFGAVTELVLRTHPVVPATVIEATWPYRDAAAVLAAWLRAAPDAPEDVNTELAFTATDDPAEPPYVTLHGLGTAGVLDAYPAPAAVTERALSGAQAAVWSAYPGQSDDVIVAGPPPGAPPGRLLVRSGFFGGGLPVPALVHAFAAGRVRGQFRDLELVPWGGALARGSGGAFAHRDARFLLKAAVQVGPMATDARRAAARDWLAGTWLPVARSWSGGVYPNYADPGIPPWSPAYHGASLPRLRAAKRRYDPADVFHLGN